MNFNKKDPKLVDIEFSKHGFTNNILRKFAFP